MEKEWLNNETIAANARLIKRYQCRRTGIMAVIVGVESLGSDPIISYMINKKGAAVTTISFKDFIDRYRLMV